MGLLDSVTSRVSSAASSVTKAASDAATTVKQAATSAAQTVEKTASSVASSASSTATAAAEKVSQATTEVKKTVVTAQTQAVALAKHTADVGASQLRNAVQAKIPSKVAVPKAPSATPAANTTAASPTANAAPAPAAAASTAPQLTPEQTTAKKNLETSAGYKAADAKVQQTISQKCEENPNLYAHYAKLVNTDSFKTPVDNGQKVTGADAVKAQQRLTQVVGELGNRVDRADAAHHPEQKAVIKGTLDSITSGRVGVEMADNKNCQERMGVQDPANFGGANLSGRSPPTVLINRESLGIGTEGISAEKSEKSGLTKATQMVGTLAHEVNHASRSNRLPEPVSNVDRYKEEMTGYAAESLATTGRMPTTEQYDNVQNALSQPPYDIKVDDPEVRTARRALEKDVNFGFPVHRPEDAEGWGGYSSVSNPDPVRLKADHDRASSDARAAFASQSEQLAISPTSDASAQDTVKNHGAFLAEATPAQREQMIKQLTYGYTTDEEKNTAYQIANSATDPAERERLNRLVADD